MLVSFWCGTIGPRLTASATTLALVCRVSARSYLQRSYSVVEEQCAFLSIYNLLYAWPRGSMALMDTLIRRTELWRRGRVKRRKIWNMKAVCIMFVHLHERIRNT